MSAIRCQGVEFGSSRRSSVRTLVYIAYFDDSGSTGRNAKDSQSPFQVVAAVLIKDHYFNNLESFLSRAIFDLVPKDRWKTFEFHANHLFRARGPFTSLGQDKCRELLARCLGLVQSEGFPVVYGAVNKSKHNESFFGGAHPIDVAFRTCAVGLEAWLEKHDNQELALCIADDTKDSSAKEALKNAFRSYRTRLWPSPNLDRGIMPHFFDDIYFGESNDSLGIQLADVCSFFISRHLAQKFFFTKPDQDSECFYAMIRKNIVYHEVVPK